MRIDIIFRAVCACCYLSIVTFTASVVHGAPYAAVVMDARTGEILHSRNADTRLHPASLTKMMTLYVVFDAVERGEINIDKKVKISHNAANERPSRLGMRVGQKISLRHLIRASAVKSANDAATALAEAISGSEKEFAKRMTSTGRALGMKKSTFKNAHGLTQRGHMSTARDMTLLGRRLFYDFPEYYNLFSRKSADAGVRNVSNTNHKLLGKYRGADGIKTGYTVAAGFNLVASAHRGPKRVIATVFGGRTSGSRNARVAELLDMGFERSKVNVALRALAPVDLGVYTKAILVAESGAVKVSLWPKSRPSVAPFRVSSAKETEERQPVLQTRTTQEIQVAVLAANLETATRDVVEVRSDKVQQSAKAVQEEPSLRVVTRVSTAGNQYWAVQVGAFSSRHNAEKALLQIALRELQSLEGAERRIEYAAVNGTKKFRARFVGLNQADANLACTRLSARNQHCAAINMGP